MDDEGQRFKDYVHSRLDKMGVPHSVPTSEHDKAGCRIGGRLDYIEHRLATHAPIPMTETSLMKFWPEVVPAPSPELRDEVRSTLAGTPSLHSGITFLSDKQFDDIAERFIDFIQKREQRRG